jgi:hypothetical protein
VANYHFVGIIRMFSVEETLGGSARARSSVSKTPSNSSTYRNQFGITPAPGSARIRSRLSLPYPTAKPVTFFQLTAQLHHNAIRLLIRQIEDGGPTIRRPLSFKSFCYRAPDPTIFYKSHRVIIFRAAGYSGGDGSTPIETTDSKIVDINRYSWERHCRGLFEFPIAA